MTDPIQRERLRFTKSRDQLVSVIKKHKTPEIRRDEIEYSEEDCLGKGGFAVVYKGVCRGCKVAIKVPIRSVFHGVLSEQLLAFKEEVKMLSKISHPNLCLFMGCYHGDLGDGDAEVMIITELLGEDLKHVLLEDVAKRPIPLMQRMRWVRQAARGMNWLHHSGIIHLDFKLSNCMLDRKSDILKIADFGLSKAVALGRFVRNPKSAVGTPIYTAPEIIDLSNFSHKSDVYSFGICLAVFITRVSATQMMNAHEYSTKEDLMQAVVAGLRPDIEQNCDFCSPALLRLSKSCWTKKPSERPTFEMILEELEAGLVVESAIRSRFACSVWMSMNPVRERVPFEEFWQALMHVSKVRKPKSTKSVTAQLFRVLFGATDEDDSVYVESWDKMVGYFGPCDVDGWIKSVKSTCSNSWFFGNVNSKQAEQLLRVSGRGCFLVRFSSRGSSFTLSYVKGKRVYHTRILHDYEGISFQLEGAKTQYFASLEKLVASIIKTGYEKISKVCSHGNPFAQLFCKDSNDVGGYTTSK